MLVSNFLPLPAKAIGAPSATTTERAPAASWFDGGLAAGGDVRISADPAIGSRGLSAAQHASQVLSHLCAEPEERA